MNIQEIKTEQQAKVSALFKATGVFFAFSNVQFETNKTPLPEDDKYVSFGGGGYLPKSKLREFMDGMDAIDAWFKKAVASNKARRQYIAYELANHEAYYTGDIQDTLNALGGDYTCEEVNAVYLKNLKTQQS